MLSLLYNFIYLITPHQKASVYGFEKFLYVVWRFLGVVLKQHVMTIQVRYISLLERITKLIEKRTVGFGRWNSDEKISARIVLVALRCI